jgi:hypothetical protein
MPATIQFDRELCGRTIEIQDVGVQRMLASKFVACKISVPQMTPKNALRVRCLLFATNERDSRRIILVTDAIFEKQEYTPHLNPLSAKRGEADEGVHAGVFALVTCSSPLPLAKGED